MNDHTSNAAVQRLWAAFRYIAGEMNPQETAEYEQHLLADQAAREAVAEVVELSGAVAAAPALSREVRPAQQPSANQGWLHRVGWLSMGAAAMLAGVLVVQSFGIAGRTTTPVVEVPSEAEQLEDKALAEVLLKSDEAVQQTLAWHPTEDPELSETLATAPAESEVAIPDWLVTAISRRDEASPSPPSQDPPEE